jgi:hypothetical protein
VVRESSHAARVAPMGVMRQRSEVHEALLPYRREHLGRGATAPPSRGIRARGGQGASEEIASAAGGGGALAARCGEVSVTPEMLVADAEQGCRDRSLASQRDRPGAAASVRLKRSRTCGGCFTPTPAGLSRTPRLPVSTIALAAIRVVASAPRGCASGRYADGPHDVAETRVRTGAHTEGRARRFRRVVFTRGACEAFRPLLGCVAIDGESCSRTGAARGPAWAVERVRASGRPPIVDPPRRESIAGSARGGWDREDGAAGVPGRVGVGADRRSGGGG